jgi:hypothetical protein
MGNSFHTNSLEPENADYLSKNVLFFKELDIKWISVFIETIRSEKAIDLRNSLDSISWRNYFGIFSKIRGSLSSDKAAASISVWHPATFEYAMQAGDDFNSPILPAEEKNLDPAYTDDEASVLSDEELQVKRSRGRSIHMEHPSEGDIERPKFDQKIINPIFFGYSNVKMAATQAQQAKHEATLKFRGDRAISTAKSSRMTAVEHLKSSSEASALHRMKTLDEMKTKYETTAAAKLKELEVNRVELSEIAFRAFKVRRAYFLLNLVIIIYQVGNVGSMGGELQCGKDSVRIRVKRAQRST